MKNSGNNSSQHQQINYLPLYEMQPQHKDLDSVQCCPQMWENFCCRTIQQQHPQYRAQIKHVPIVASLTGTRRKLGQIHGFGMTETRFWSMWSLRIRLFWHTIITLYCCHTVFVHSFVHCLWTVVAWHWKQRCLSLLSTFLNDVSVHFSLNHQTPESHCWRHDKGRSFLWMAIL